MFDSLQSVGPFSGQSIKTWLTNTFASCFFLVKTIISLYQRIFGMRAEFSHDSRFSFEGFDDEDSFLVLGQPCTNNAMSTQTRIPLYHHQGVFLTYPLH